MTWFALSIWPIISSVVFNKARLPIALLVTLIGGYLLLPTTVFFNLPILPSLNKDTIPALVALLFVLIKAQPQRFGAQPTWQVLPGILPREPVVLTLFLLLFVGHVGTHMFNRDPLFYGPTVLPGLRFYDAAAVMMVTVLQFVPFLLARKVLSAPEGQRLILITLAISAAIYAFLAIYELRMSPQLNRMVYGFFPHDFAQHLRSWGWRPVVFLEHGLRLSLFFGMAVISAAVMVTVETGKQRTLWVFMTIWLLIMLVFSKSLGVLLSALVMLSILYFLPKRLQITFVFGVTVCILLYPIIRAADLLPYEYLLSNVDPQRAHSLSYRLDSEQILMEKANERPIFGWGGWGRSRVYNEEGLDVAVPDGSWIIWLGLGGWLKYISIFGLLSWGILQLLWQRGKNIDKESVGLALVLTVNLIDLIPNSGISPITWILAGALCGRLEYKAGQFSNADVAEKEAPGRREIVYSRDIKSRYKTETGDSAPEASRDALPYRRRFDGADK